MTAEKNLVVVFEGKTYDAFEIIRKIKAKYGENPIISEDAKRYKTIKIIEKAK